MLNGLKMGFTLQTRVENTILEKGLHSLSWKENVLGAVVSKKWHVDSLMGDDRTHLYWFLEKKIQL